MGGCAKVSIGNWRTIHNIDHNSHLDTDQKPSQSFITQNKATTRICQRALSRVVGLLKYWIPPLSLFFMVQILLSVLMAAPNGLIRRMSMSNKKIIKFFKLLTTCYVLALILLCGTQMLYAQCNESGSYLVCEDWDSGSPPVGWPDKGDPIWNGWKPADYGDVSSNSGDIIANLYHSAAKSLVLIKSEGRKGVSDLEHDIPGNPSRVFARFYLRIPSGQMQNVGSFAHVVFLNTASSAEVALDFRRCGEVNGGYYDCNPSGNHYLAIHSYSPEVWIANNQGARGSRNYFVWEEHENEWVCVEWMVDFANDRTSLWINGQAQVVDYDMEFTYSSASSIYLSGFSQDTSGEINFHYDDVVVNTNYIGLRGVGSPAPQPIVDVDSPLSTSFSPVNNAVNVSPSTNIVAHILDGGDGVDRDSIEMQINGVVVTPEIGGTAADYTLSYDSPQDYSAGELVTVTLNAQDLHSPPNKMPEVNYSFTIASDTSSGGSGSGSGCSCCTTLLKSFGDSSRADYSNNVQDTYLTTDDINHAGDSQSLIVYTWPTNTAANRVAMKWNLTTLPTTAVVQKATLSLYMSGYEGDGGDNNYDISVHKIINHDPDISTATWSTCNSSDSWTGGQNGGVQDMAPAESTTSVDKNAGYKTWDVTNMVKEWIGNPNRNYGMILNADTSATADSNRIFRPSEYSDTTQRPILTIQYYGLPSPRLWIVKSNP